MSHFNSKQCRDQFDHPYFCYPAPRACSVAFRASLVKRFLLDLDNFGGADPYGFFPLFFKMIADVLAPKLATLFRYLVRSGTFPDCWKTADVVPVPKGAPSSQVGNYRPISITPVLSKIFERVIAVKFGRFLEDESLLSSCQFAYRKD